MSAVGLQGFVGDHVAGTKVEFPTNFLWASFMPMRTAVLSTHLRSSGDLNIGTYYAELRVSKAPVHVCRGRSLVPLKTWSSFFVVLTLRVRPFSRSALLWRRSV